MLVVLVGHTVQTMQAVGWMPVTPVEGLTLPYWAGIWFGVFPTWEGLLLQGAALVVRARQLRRGGGAQEAEGRRILAAPVAVASTGQGQRPTSQARWASSGSISFSHASATALGEPGTETTTDPR